MFAMYVLGTVVIILTGLSLFSEQYGWGSVWTQPVRPGSACCSAAQGWSRLVHHLAMYYLLIFAVIHMYMVLREDVMSGEQRCWHDDQRPAHVQVVAGRLSSIGPRPHSAACPRWSPQCRRPTAYVAGQPASLGVSARRPPHPGQFLDSRFLRPLGISQTELAAALGVSRRRVNELINGKRAITPDTAVRLAMYFGNEAAFWMHLQVAWDMHTAVREVRCIGTSRLINIHLANSMTGFDVTQRGACVCL